jgi:hypothetical protein
MKLPCRMYITCAKMYIHSKTSQVKYIVNAEFQNVFLNNEVMIREVGLALYLRVNLTFMLYTPCFQKRGPVTESLRYKHHICSTEFGTTEFQVNKVIQASPFHLLCRKHNHLITESSSNGCIKIKLV